MALTDILFSEGTAEGQDFIVEINVVSTGALSDITYSSTSNTNNDATIEEIPLKQPIITIVRKVR